MILIKKCYFGINQYIVLHRALVKAMGLDSAPRAREDQDPHWPAVDVEPTRWCARREKRRGCEAWQRGARSWPARSLSLTRRRARAVRPPGWTRGAVSLG
jgi:hypothetical protein